MFKTKISIVDEKWELIHEYKARLKPAVDEFIFVNLRYYKVLAVVHSIDLETNAKTLTVMVKLYKDFTKKD
jgi:hypothetical protein